MVVVGRCAAAVRGLARRGSVLRVVVGYVAAIAVAVFSVSPMEPAAIRASKLDAQ